MTVKVDKLKHVRTKHYRIPPKININNIKTGNEYIKVQINLVDNNKHVATITGFDTKLNILNKTANACAIYEFGDRVCGTPKIEYVNELPDSPLGKVKIDWKLFWWL